MTLSENGVLLFFRGNVLYNAYIPTREARNYFKDQVKEPIPLHKGDDDGPERGD